MAHTRITAVWSGFIGAPGYTGMNFEGSLDSAGAGSAASRMHAFFTAIRAYIPTECTITWDPTAQNFNSVGQLEGETAYTPPAPITGAGSAAYAGGSGAVVNWATNVFRAGRRFRGRTYLVPLTSQAYQNDGTLATAALGTLQDAASALLVGAPGLCVFGGSPERGYATGTVTAAVVPDRAATLRSRRS